MRGFIILAAGLFGFVITAHAQGPGSQPRQGVPVEQRLIDPSHEIKASGCLGKEEDRFVLKDAAIEITPWLASGVKKDAAGKPKASPSKTVFTLQNATGLDAHVGHRIEVTGSVAPASANLPPNPDTIATSKVAGIRTPTQGAGVLRIAHPGLNNTGLRMIAATCS